MTKAREIMQDEMEEKSWSLETAFNILCEYVDERNFFRNDTLEDFLADKNGV